VPVLEGSLVGKLDGQVASARVAACACIASQSELSGTLGDTRRMGGLGEWVGGQLGSLSKFRDPGPQGKHAYLEDPAGLRTGEYSSLTSKKLGVRSMLALRLRREEHTAK